MVPVDFSRGTICFSVEKLTLVSSRAGARLLGQGVWPRQAWLDLLTGALLDWRKASVTRLLFNHELVC